MTMTFERAKLELRMLGRRYEGGAIDIDEWCQGVHDVLAAFQEARDARAAYSAALTATALPAPSDSSHAVAAHVREVLTNAHSADNRMMTGHGA